MVWAAWTAWAVEAEAWLLCCCFLASGCAGGEGAFEEREAVAFEFCCDAVCARRGVAEAVDEVEDAAAEGVDASCLAGAVMSVPPAEAPVLDCCACFFFFFCNNCWCCA